MDRTERTKRSLLTKLSDRGVFKPFYVTLYIIFGFGFLVYIISRISPSFAEYWTRYPGQGVRFILAKLTTLLPFSLAECMVILIPLFLFSIIAFAVKYRISKQNNKIFGIIMNLVSIILIISTIFLMGFGPAYFRYPLSKNLSLTDSPVSGEALYETAAQIADELDIILPDIVFAEGGESHLPMTYNELCDELNEAFSEFALSSGFITSFNSFVKPISLSEYMTYTHISGVYTFFTGEANVNYNYPDFILPYTMAHEMSHQRGIAREDEANFVSFLVCINSDNSYIKYSGYVNVLREVMSALKKSDKSLYNIFVQTRYQKVVSDEMAAYSRFFDKYRESTAAKVVSTTNNAYLSSQNVKAGVKSYGLVTDLAVAYYQSKNKHN